MHLLKSLSTILLVVGGINLGLIALLDLNIVEMFLGSIAFGVDAVYALIGLSAIYYVVDGKVFDF